MQQEIHFNIIRPGGGGTGEGEGKGGGGRKRGRGKGKGEGGGGTGEGRMGEGEGGKLVIFSSGGGAISQPLLLFLFSLQPQVMITGTLGSSCTTTPSTSHVEDRGRTGAHVQDRGPCRGRPGPM